MKTLILVSVVVISIGIVAPAGHAAIPDPKPDPPADPAPAVQPGELVQSKDVTCSLKGGQLLCSRTECTLNFVLDGADGRVFVGSAGHCFATGEEVGHENTSWWGSVAYSVVTEDSALDFALIEVNESMWAHVDPEVKGHPGTPTGIASSSAVATGDVLLFSGQGIGANATETTRENRTGVLVTMDAALYCAEGPVVYHDSGGPVVHDDTGWALGAVKGHNTSACPAVANPWGPTMESVIDHLSVHGFDVTLRTWDA